MVLLLEYVFPVLFPPLTKFTELLPCDWLISNVCYQAIEQLYLIKWPGSLMFNVFNIIVLLLIINFNTCICICVCICIYMYCYYCRLICYLF